MAAEERTTSTVEGVVEASIQSVWEAVGGEVEVWEKVWANVHALEVSLAKSRRLDGPIPWKGTRGHHQRYSFWSRLEAR